MYDSGATHNPDARMSTCQATGARALVCGEPLDPAIYRVAPHFLMLFFAII